MKFKTLHGGVRSVFKPKKYLIDWDGKSRSKFQAEAKAFLRQYWESHIGVFEEFPVAGTLMSLDFYNSYRRIAIEVQGRQHRKYVPFFHQNNVYNLTNQMSNDRDKLQFCEMNDIKLVEIYKKEELSESFFKKCGVSL